MARPIVIDDEAILAAAREVFLERGIAATTADVAVRAGVSEGSVFRRFKTKAELFQTAMIDGLARENDLESTLVSKVGQGDMKQQLVELALDSVAHMRVVVPLVMMSWSNPSPSGVPVQLHDPNPRPIRVLRALSSYFEAEMRLGRLRRHDPEIVARTFMGAVWNYAMLEIVFESQQLMPLPAESFARGFVELQWAALDPAGAGGRASVREEARRERAK